MPVPQFEQSVQLTALWQDRLPIVLGCTGRSAELIEEHQQLRTVPPGTDIFVQATKPEAIFLLLKGSMHMIGSQGQREARLGKITSGMLCDIAACILGAPHNYTARSATACDLVALPIAIWQLLVKELPSVSIQAAAQLSNDLRKLLKQIASR